MMLTNGNIVKCSNIVKDTIKCKVIDSKYNHNAIEVEILEGTWKGNKTVVNLESIEVIDEIEMKTEDLTNALSDAGFTFSLSGFGDSNWLSVETFSYEISICIDEEGYTASTKNLNRKEYGIYEDEDKNHKSMKKASTVVKYINRFDK